MTRKFFGTDGIRGEVGVWPVTPDFVVKLGWAAGTVFARHIEHGKKSILIGKDTRISGYMFESALEAGIIAAGVDVGLLGPMPTPAIAYLTRTLKAQAGIVISASHNPYYDNGIKFFSADGRKLPDDIELEIEAQLECQMTTRASAELGKAFRVSDAIGRYIEFCKSTVPATLHLEGMKIAVDCANGATYHCAPNVMRELGADVIELAVDPDGLNINDQCGSTYPAMLQREVVACGADLGIAFDGDGDRVLFVDHRGELLDGDEILYVIARDRLRRNLPCVGVVGTLMSNLGLEQSLSQLGVAFMRTNVGDRYVTEAMQQTGWNVGGESSGHILCHEYITTGDAIVSALQVLFAVVDGGHSLHELKQGMTKYPQVMINVRLKNRPDLQASSRIASAIRDAEAILAKSGRVLLRPSGTEPLVRVMVEGQDAHMVRKLAEQLAAVVEAEFVN